MFNLNDEKWREQVGEWLEEAYEFDCFLVYAIGTKKDEWAKRRYK
jgi:hypothetical protein